MWRPDIRWRVQTTSFIRILILCRWSSTPPRPTSFRTTKRKRTGTRSKTFQLSRNIKCRLATISTTLMTRLPVQFVGATAGSKTSSDLEARRTGCLSTSPRWDPISCPRCSEPLIGTSRPSHTNFNGSVSRISGYYWIGDWIWPAWRKPSPSRRCRRTRFKRWSTSSERADECMELTRRISKKSTGSRISDFLRPWRISSERSVTPEFFA